MVEIVGKKTLNFTSQDTGEVINGVQYFFTDDSPDEGLTGSFAGKKFISMKMFSALDYKPEVGDWVEFVFNSRGKFSGFKCMQPAVAK